MASREQGRHIDVWLHLLRQAHKRNKHQWAEGQATEVPFIYFNPYQIVRSSFGLHLVDGLLVLRKTHMSTSTVKKISNGDLTKDVKSLKLSPSG